MCQAIVKTKLLPPALPQATVWRPRLMKALRQLTEHRLTLLCAEMGYGKSTALAAFFRSGGLPVCWYTTGSEERDLPLFVAYLIHAVQTRYPAFAAALVEKLADSSCQSLTADPYWLCAQIVNELCERTEPIAIVLDDYHLVESSQPVDRFVQYLVAHLPEHVHLVVVSRTYPNWEMLATYRLKNQLLELGPEQLAFDREEFQLLLGGEDEQPFPADWAEQIYRKTEGWVMAAEAVRQRMKGQPLSSEVWDAEETFDELFASLRVEVWQKQPPEIRDVLLKTSVLEWLSEPLCAALGDAEEGERLLQQIRRQGLFVRAAGRDTYRYHSLFRQFLQRQLLQQQALAVDAHRRAAQFFLKQQAYLSAISHLLALGAYEAVARLFQDHGQTILKEADPARLRQLLQQIPEAVKDRHYLLWICEGDLYRYLNRYEQAIACYTRGEQRAVQAGVPLAENVGLQRKAQIFLDTIEPNKAARVLNQVLGTALTAESASAATSVEYYQLIAENLLNSGRSHEAERWYRRCQLLQADFQDEQLEARLYLRTGRLAEARHLLERKWHRESDKLIRLRPQSHRETTVLLSFVEAVLGNPEKAEQLADSAISQGAASQSPYLEACGWMRKGHALQLLSGYEEELSHTCYRKALELMEAIHVRRGKAEPLMGLCLLYGRLGQTRQAVACGRQALEETEKAQDAWLSAWIRLSIAIALFYGQSWSEASRQLAHSGEQFQICGDAYGVTVARMWQALLAYQTKRDAWEEVMNAFLQLLEDGGYHFLFSARTLFGPRDVRQLIPPLLQAHQQQLLPAVTAQLISTLGLYDVSYHPGYTLEIGTLGTFCVRLGEKEVLEREWQRGKAKELFQLLLTYRDRLLPKDEIIALLWSDADEKAANRDFKVALHALNTALEPNRQARSRPFFIERQGAFYRIHPEAGFSLDAADFESLIKQGLEAADDERAKALLTRGMRLYKGDYLPDRLHAEWCSGERERLRLLYLKGAERLAALFLKQGAYDQAAYWCEQIIRKDACWEAAYQLLMKALYASNNRLQAVKWYQRLCEVLRVELGVEPQPTTQQLYRNITSQEWSDG